MDFEQEKKDEKLEHYRNILDIVRTAINVKGILTRKSIDEAAKKVVDIGFSDVTFLHVANRMKRMYEESKGIG